MSAKTNSLPRWTVRIASSLILLSVLFWTWLGIVIELPDPQGRLMHILIPDLLLVTMGLLCWRLPVVGGAVLTLWGASPLLLLVGSRPVYIFHNHWLSLDPLITYWIPLLLGIVLVLAGNSIRKFKRPL